MLDVIDSIATPTLADEIDAVADSLFEAHRSRMPIEPIAARLGSEDVDAAYAVQQRNTQRWLDGGRSIAGRKIGLTSIAVQRQLGVDQPDFGTIFADEIYGDGDRIAASRLIQPKAEAEVALTMAHGLEDPDCSLDDLVAGIGAALPAIEIVDSRIRDWRISLVDTIADNASSGVTVLGSRSVPVGGIDLSGVAMAMRIDGEPVSTGSGRDCLGNPLNAALWLARQMALRGTPLRAGDLVMTGALGPMTTVEAGMRIDVDISGLGTVSCRIERTGDGE